MKTLSFRTNIDCPLRAHKAACALECLHGRYCQFSMDLMQTDHILTVKTEDLEDKDVILALGREGIVCETLLKMA